MNVSSHAFWDASALTPDADAGLRKFRAAYQAQVAAYQLLKLDWPDADLSLRGLFSYLSTGVVQNDGEPVIFAIALAALNAHSKAVEQTQPDPVRMMLFQQALFGEVVKHFAQLRLTDDQGREWSVCQGQTLSEWGKDATGTVTVHHDLGLSESDVYEILIERFLTRAQCNVISINKTIAQTSCTFVNHLRFESCQ